MDRCTLCGMTSFQTALFRNDETKEPKADWRCWVHLDEKYRQKYRENGLRDLRTVLEDDLSQYED